MIDLLNRKLRQMHAALVGLRVSDPSSIRPTIVSCAEYSFTSVDFGQNADPVALANAASLLVANIASLKDHLKAWCKKQSVSFHGDALINSNRSVALIHDLWNVDKHAELNSPPRSGSIPKLQGTTTALVVSASGAGSGAFFSMDPFTGKMTTGTTGGGTVSVSLVAQIVDPHGNMLGDFQTVCVEAAEAWEAEIRKAGVPLI